MKIYQVQFQGGTPPQWFVHKEYKRLSKAIEAARCWRYGEYHGRVVTLDIEEGGVVFTTETDDPETVATEQGE